MKLILENKKLALIISLVLVCGLILHFSRSTFVLSTAKNDEVIAEDDSLLQSTSKGSQVVSNANYCIVYTDETTKLKENIEQTIDYLQKSYKSFDADFEKVDYDACHNILLASSYLKHLGTIEEIEQFVSNGGNLFFMQTLEPDTQFLVLNRHFGIVYYNDFVETTGIEMQSNVLLGTAGREFLTETLEDFSLSVLLDNQTKVFMQSTTQNPLLWKTNFEKGKFMVFNGSFLSQKVSRGVITGMLSLMDDTFIYPIFNAKTFYIDDFPSPIAKGKNELIYNEFKKDLPAFYKTIWWPDMLKTAKKYNLLFTGALIESYTDDVDPPYTNPGDDDLSNLISFGRELIQHGGELGFHGYNHQSLTMDAKVAKSFGYKPWPSTEDMQGSINELVAYAKEAFPSYKITSYVPPSNVLSEEGRTALRKALPSLVTIASLYSQDDTNRSYVQEFDIADDQIVNMPRISSGYYRNDYNEWAIANALTTHGVFSHFIHPDDVISEDRGRGGWTDTFEEFNHFMQDINDRYPWLRALPSTKAAYLQAATLHSKVTLTQTETEIRGNIENFTSPQYFVLRTTNRIKDSLHCTYKTIDSNTYLILAEQKQFKILLKRDDS